MSKSAKSNLGHKRKLTHRQKRKMGLAMMTPLDKRLGRSWYQGQSWLQRKYAIALRVWKRQRLAQSIAASKRAAKEATK